MYGGMKMAFEEKYSLEPSEQFNLVGREEKNEDLQLSPSIEPDSGSISGTVHGSDGTPIAGATIKLFDNTGQPFEHVNSNSSGLFDFAGIPAGSYFITASKPGFLTPSRIPVSVIQNGSASVDITMSVDPNANSNALYGIVFDTSNNKPVDNATVELFLVQSPEPVSHGRVLTNAEGQYLFADLPDGDYFVTANKAGYLTTRSSQVHLTNKEYASLNINLNANPDDNTGTISGIIKDQQTGIPIANATVALYSVSGSVEKIVQITRTNAGGLYLFGDLPQGQYKVKATVQTAT